MLSIACTMVRPQRSSFQTMTQSIWRLCAASMIRLSAGLPVFDPDQPVSTYSPWISQSRRLQYSRISRSCISHF